MLYKVSVLKQAELDIDNAYIWYELQQKGLGNIFFSSLNKAVTFISHNPLNCRAYYKNVRRIIINKFPYGIYYNVNLTEKEIQIIGVIHFKRSSKILRNRL